MSPPVLFDTLATHGLDWGVATLNAPATLNALSLPMLQALAQQLAQWAIEPAIAGVLLQAGGGKAFCAGGDIRSMYHSMRCHGGGPNPMAQAFFATEYALDHAIHTYPKPVLCWSHGITMGGGVGLMAGASHRVVTPGSRLAMPEISIGLYPDVGGSWFLRRMPGRVGLFLALTGAPLNTADALFCGLADHGIAHESKGAVLAQLSHAAWTGDAQRDRAALSRLLAGHGCALPESPVRTHFDQIQQLMASDDLQDIDARLRALRSEDPWLVKAVQTYAQGSPTSAALAFALWQRVPRMSLAEVLRLEYQVSLGCCAHPDFAEGVRALLIDKDCQPRWSPARLADVTPEWLEEHFKARHAGAHPLAALI